MQRAALLSILVLSLAVYGAAQNTGGTTGGGTTGGTTQGGATAPTAGSQTTPGPTASPTPVTSQPATQPGAPTVPPNQPNTAPPATAPSQAGVPVGPGLVQQGGFVQQSVGGTTVLAPAGATPLIKTPIVTLDAPPSDPVGASNATGNLDAGATNSTLAQPNVSTQGMIIDQFEANTPAGFDPGPGAGSGVGSAVGIAGPGGGGMALGDAARQMRGSRGQTNARVYTNEDVQRLNQAPGFRSGEQIEREETLATAARPGEPGTEAEGVTPMAPEANGEPVAEQGAGQAAGTDLAQDRVVTDTRQQRTQARAQGGAATTPQVDQQEGAQGQAQDGEREELPASASPLPLAGLLGLLLAGGGIAYVIRRK